MVVVTKGHRGARPPARRQFEAYLKKTFPGTDAFVNLLDIGPPVGRPVQYRVSGPDIAKVRDFAQSLAAIVRPNPHLGDVVFDWMEPARVVKVNVLQDKARQLGVRSQDIAATLNSVVDGATSPRCATTSISSTSSAGPRRRARLDRDLADLQLPDRRPGRAARRGRQLRYELEQPTIWRRSRLPTITLKASVLRRRPASDRRRPTGAAGGEIRKRAAGRIYGRGRRRGRGKRQGQAPIEAVVPLMLFIMATILMVQLQSFQRLFLVFAVAPLALIGVVVALLPSGAPLGFVAILGVLALIGILIRNSVILIVQIENLKEAGRPWDAVVEATEHRMRPILLTAAAASLALIPIAREIFWGPMAYAMMGGIIVGTVLTLLFLPALYVAWFRIKEPIQASAESETRPSTSDTGELASILHDAAAG